MIYTMHMVHSKNLKSLLKQFKGTKQVLNKIVNFLRTCLRLLEELIYMVYEIFRWDVDCIDELPDYMKIFYRRLLNICNEIEEEMVKQGTSYRVHYAKEAVCIYCLLTYR